MKIIYYKDYKERRDDKKYSHIKKELKRKEKRVINANSIDDLTFYQDLSSSRKSQRFGDKKGGYRLALFFYKEYCLFVDFESKKVLEAVGGSETLFKNMSNEDLIEYIKSHKDEEKIVNIDLNDYKDIINFESNCSQEELIFETLNFSKQLESSFNSLDKIYYTLQKNILNYSDNMDTYKNYKTIFQISDNIFYKLFSGDILLFLLLSKDDNLDEIDRLNSKEELLKRSVKSYPVEALLDESSSDWIEYIVKNSDGNIALSPEEENILLKLKSYRSSRYPFFINGRAGSGKSTILQYLFSFYLIKFLEIKKSKELEYKPLYLTYNDRLRDKAVDKVVSIILAKNQSELKRLNIEGREALQKEIDGYFKSFDTKDGLSFLEEILHCNGVKSPFKGRRKLSFEEIKGYFEGQIIKRGRGSKELSAELIWYVIRSYIKGRGRIEDGKLKELDTNGYSSLSKKLKSVDESIYQVIYENFYKSYKSHLKDNNLYDDLDLVFEVYRNNAFDKKYSIIFCDEAQDFTKVEFDLILALNIFLQHNIEIEQFDSKNIPILFAGDPFQTINPTGFNFSYLKALVYESYQRKGIESNLNDEELKFNYRSNSEIIKFSNLIQLLRGVLFRDKSIKLQKEWLSSSSKNSILLFTTPIEKESFYQFIFPTNRYEEYRGDRLFESFDIEHLDRPIDIKGLEYDVIVLYRFGDFFLKYYSNNDNLERFIDKGFTIKEESLKYEYFMNNFYVAITRAKKKIIIIDSEEAKRDFWGSINIETIFNRYKEINSDIDINNLLSFEVGEVEYLQESEENRVKLTIQKLNVDIFERYDGESEEAKKAILSNTDKAIESQPNLSPIYKNILNGLREEMSSNYILASKYLIRAVIEAKEREELNSEQLSYLTKLSFNSLCKVALKNPQESFEILDSYKNEFLKYTGKLKRRFETLYNFLANNYIEALWKILDNFEPIELNENLKSILEESLDRADERELYEIFKTLYERNFISRIDIEKFFKNRLNRESLDYESLIKLAKIDDFGTLKDEILEKLSEKIDNIDKIKSLVKLNSVDRISEIFEGLEESDEVESSDIDELYFATILAVSECKEEREEILDILFEINILTTLYIKWYKKLDIKIWRYIAKRLFRLEEDDEKIAKILFFFKNASIYDTKEHIDVVIDEFKRHNRPFINIYLFNQFIELFNEYEFRGCDIVSSLENSIDFSNTDSIDKILNCYTRQIKRKSKYNPLIGSRFIKIKYEYDKRGEEKFSKKSKRKRRGKDSWLDFVKRRVKFLKVKANEETIKAIPDRLSFDLCQNSKLYNIKFVDKIYKKIITDMDKRTLKQTKKERREESRDKFNKNSTPKEAKPKEKESNLNKVESIEAVEIDSIDSHTYSKKNRIEKESQMSKKRESESTKKRADEKKQSESIELLRINRENLIDILETIQEFIDENGNELTKRELRRVSNTIIGIKKDVDRLKLKLK